MDLVLCSHLFLGPEWCVPALQEPNYQLILYLKMRIELLITGPVIVTACGTVQWEFDSFRTHAIHSFLNFCDIILMLMAFKILGNAESITMVLISFSGNQRNPS